MKTNGVVRRLVSSPPGLERWEAQCLLCPWRSGDGVCMLPRAQQRQLINTVLKPGRIPALLGRPRNAKRGAREQLPVCLVRSPQARLQASLAVAHRKSGV